MKSIYVTGAIAGFLAGIPAAIFGGIILQMGLLGFSLSTMLELLPLSAIMHIGFNTLWGIIFGILFAKFYDVIPGTSGVKKGLFWGLIYAIVPEWWVGSYVLAHGLFWSALLWAVYGPVVIIFYGLPLGFLYKRTQQPVKIEDKTKHNPIAGVVAGLVAGIVAAVLTFNQFMMGMWFVWSWGVYAYTASIAVAIEFVLMVIWGIIFNVLFVLYYPRLPGKNVMKGLYYGLILASICPIYYASAALGYMGTFPGVLEASSMMIIVYGLSFISYGIVLGYFYKK